MVEDIQKEIDKLNEVSGREVAKLSDGHHTFDELYEFRKVYNAMTANLLSKYTDFPIYKSWKHSDGEYCFGEDKKWFIVEMHLPTGQVSNHYRAIEWDLFKIKEVEIPTIEYNGHKPKDTLITMSEFIKLND